MGLLKLLLANLKLFTQGEAVKALMPKASAESSFKELLKRELKGEVEVKTVRSSPRRVKRANLELQPLIPTLPAVELKGVKPEGKGSSKKAVSKKVKTEPLNLKELPKTKVSSKALPQKSRALNLEPKEPLREGLKELPKEVELKRAPEPQKLTGSLNLKPLKRPPQKVEPLLKPQLPLELQPSTPPKEAKQLKDKDFKAFKLKAPKVEPSKEVKPAALETPVKTKTLNREKEPKRVEFSPKPPSSFQPPEGGLPVEESSLNPQPRGQVEPLKRFGGEGLDFRGSTGPQGHQPSAGGGVAFSGESSQSSPQNSHQSGGGSSLPSRPAAEAHHPGGQVFTLRDGELFLKVAVYNRVMNLTLQLPQAAVVDRELLSEIQALIKSSGFTPGKLYLKVKGRGSSARENRAELRV